MNLQSTEYWVRQAQAGNIEAFNHLAKTFQALAYREAIQWLGDEQQAEDATQDAFLAAYQHLHQLRQPGAFNTWLRQIVRSQCNLQTRKKRYPTEPLDAKPHLAAPIPTPETVLEREEQSQTIRAAIDALPDHERQVTEDYYLNGEKTADIAERLDVPVATVKKRLQYARQKLKGLITQVTVDARPSLAMYELLD